MDEDERWTQITESLGDIMADIAALKILLVEHISLIAEDQEDHCSLLANELDASISAPPKSELDRKIQQRLVTLQAVCRSLAGQGTDVPPEP